MFFQKGRLYFTDLKFGELRSGNSGWYIEITGLIHRRDSSNPWTREQMRDFWRRVCKLMRAYGVTNRYPRGPLVTLVRDPDYRYKHIPTTGNLGLIILGPVKKQKGCWDQENCAKFREEVSTLMSDQGLVLTYEPTFWVMTNLSDPEELEKTKVPDRKDIESRVEV